MLWHFTYLQAGYRHVIEGLYTCCNSSNSVNSYNFQRTVFAVFGDRTSFRAKGLRGTTWTRTFTSVFGDRTSFRAKGLRRTTCKSQFYLGFWRSNLISCEKVARDDLNSHFSRNFWRSNLISCERVAPDDLQIAILPQFLAIEPHFVRKGCAGRLVGTAPAPAFKREIEKKERARGQEGKMARGEDVRWEEKMWEDVKMRRRWEEEEKIWGWEDVKMRRCEDEKVFYRPPLLEEPCAQTLSGKSSNIPECTASWGGISRFNGLVQGKFQLEPWFLLPNWWFPAQVSFTPANAIVGYIMANLRYPAHCTQLNSYSCLVDNPIDTKD